MAFLEVVTRVYRRPTMLKRNIASLRAQRDDDYRQMFLIDAVGRGVPAANARLAHHTPTCGWVWVLDDDDECIYGGLIADVRRLVLAHNPPVIIVCMDHGELGVLPPVERWQKAPAHGEIGMSAFIVRRDIWMTHRAAFGNNNNYHGDYDFIAQVWRDTNDGEGWLWHPVIASRVQRISRGGRE